MCTKWIGNALFYIILWNDGMTKWYSKNCNNFDGIEKTAATLNIWWMFAKNICSIYLSFHCLLNFCRNLKKKKKKNYNNNVSCEKFAWIDRQRWRWMKEGENWKRRWQQISQIHWNPKLTERNQIVSLKPRKTKNNRNVSKIKNYNNIEKFIKCIVEIAHQINHVVHGMYRREERNKWNEIK